MIQKIIGTIITLDGLLSFVIAHKHPLINTPHHLQGLLQTGRIIRSSLGVVLLLS